MKIKYLAIFLLFSCNYVDPENFNDGEFAPKTKDYLEYRYALEQFLTVTDSMKGEDMILPPSCDLTMKIDTAYDLLSTEVVSIYDKTYQFKDFYDSRENFKVTYRLRAFDDKNGVVYFKVDESPVKFRIFGLSLETGNQFDVYKHGKGNKFIHMYEWDFSPSMEYLIKSGDINEGFYGWSIVNLSTGEETIASYNRFYDFITGVYWVNDNEFKFTHTKIPFNEEKAYTKDYKFFYSLLEKNPIPGYRLTSTALYPTEYTIDMKGKLLGEKMKKFEYEKKL